MRTTSRLAASAFILGGGLVLAAPASAQTAPAVTCDYPFNCPTPPTTPPTTPGTTPPTTPGTTPPITPVTTPPTTPGTTPPTTPVTVSPTTPIGNGGGGPATGEIPAASATPAPAGGGTGSGAGSGTGSGGGAAVVDNSPTGSTVSNAASLPFTGGEVTMIALAGIAALGGGVALVAAGRKRQSA